MALINVTPIDIFGECFLVTIALNSAGLEILVPKLQEVLPLMTEKVVESLSNIHKALSSTPSIVVNQSSNIKASTSMAVS